jgi:hypothetical protein
LRFSAVRRRGRSLHGRAGGKTSGAVTPMPVRAEEGTGRHPRRRRRHVRQGMANPSVCAHGIEYREVNQSASDLYAHCIHVFTAGRIEFPDIPRLVDQFCALRRKVGQGGRETIQHLRNAHDDVANAVAGLIWKLTPVFAGAGVIASPGIWTESGGWISEPRVYRIGEPAPEMVSLYVGGPVVPKDSPQARANAAAARGGAVSDGARQHVRELTEATHRAAGGQDLYGSSIPADVGWRRFDHPGDSQSW